jgi:hypothetical protein
VLVEHLEWSPALLDCGVSPLELAAERTNTPILCGATPALARSAAHPPTYAASFASFGNRRIAVGVGQPDRI